MSMLERAKRSQRNKNLATVFRNEAGAIDLASIMVGIIVIGLIGGVIAATVFAVIPWSQDNSAKQQLDSIATAENAYIGLQQGNAYGTLADLNTQKLFSLTPKSGSALVSNDGKTCVGTTNAGKGYSAAITSATNKIFLITSDNTKARAGKTGDVTCFGTLGADGQPLPTEDTIIKMTINCPTAGPIIVNGPASIPINKFNGTVDWGDGTNETLSGSGSVVNSPSHAFTKGTTYKITLNGKFTGTGGVAYASASAGSGACLRSLDALGKDTQAVSYNLSNAVNLTSAAAPTATVTNMSSAFAGSAVPFDITNWDVSHVTNMTDMFNAATFNQNINNWDVSNVTNFTRMFTGNTGFNQPLNKWNTSKATNLSSMFSGATTFNQNINNWDVSNVTNLNSTFNGSAAFNQPLNNWNTGKVTNLNSTFQSATTFNQNINNWNTSNVTVMNNTFYSASAFNQPLNNWDTSKVTQMGSMFAFTSAFNQDLSGWNVTKVTAPNRSMFALFSGIENIPAFLPQWS